MNKQFINIISAALIILLLNKVAPAQDESSGTISSIIQLPKDLHLEDQIYEDINHDGLKDFVLSISNRKKPFERSLRIYYQQKDNLGFKMEPDKIISLTTDVIAYACADIDQSPGAEILLFTANACFGYRLEEENKDKIYKIANYSFLWQIPDPYNVFSWQGTVRDFNNDGRPDLLLPQPEGFIILIQGETGFFSTPLLESPKEVISKNSNVSVNRSRSGTNISLSFGNRSNNALDAKKPLVSVNHSVSVPVFTDCDGNQLTDIVTQTPNYLYVWKQEEKTPFFTNHFISHKIPKGSKEDAEPGIYDNQYVLDLNKDKYFDFLLFKRDKTSKKVYTQILVYLNQKNLSSDAILFNEEGTPQQLIKIAGLPGNAQFRDINKDGYPDLSFVTFNPDLLDQVETLASKSIKLQFLSFFNDKKGSFSKKPDINHEFNVSLEEQNQSGIEPIRFFTDFNNDGLLDVLVRDKKNHISLCLLKKLKNAIKVSEKSVWDMTIPDKAKIVYEKTDSDTKPVLIITSSDQVIYVRFK